MSKPALVIYHDNCYDGFTAAWIAVHALGPETEVFGGKYGEHPPYDLAEGREVYIVDFSYARETMIALDEVAGSLVVLDHHKTAEAACAGLSFCTFDMDRSGAGMAWDYFNPKYIRPEWIECVEDRDLWRWRCEGTKECHAFLSSLEMTFENWDRVNCANFESIVAEGTAIMRSIDQYCETVSKLSREVKIAGVIARVVNAPYVNCSELMHLLLEKHPEAVFSMNYFQRADGAWQYGLRSRDDFDVSEVALKYGGGGHAKAAGFETNQLIPEILYTGAPIDR